MITKFVLNSVLHHVGLSWIISANKQMKHKIEENNPDWLNKVPWYNTVICSKLHGTMFEYFIRNARTYIYNIMCYITANDKQHPTYVDDANSGGGRAIPKNATTAALKILYTTLKFIDCCLQHFYHSYKIRLIIYH